jgi:hypothetical protein
MKILNQHSQSPGLDLNSELPEYDAAMLTTRPRRSITELPVLQLNLLDGRYLGTPQYQTVSVRNKKDAAVRKKQITFCNSKYCILNL